MSNVKFCLQPGESTREKTAIWSGSRKLDYEVTSYEYCRPGYIPIGSVEYCEFVAPEQPTTKDFYPQFLRPLLYRRVWLTHLGFAGGSVFDKDVFVKRADAWKSDFESRVVLAKEIVPVGDYWLSDPVQFVQEWRYYVAKGVVICSGWYAGLDEDEPAPKLDIQWPSNYSGAVDFGRLADGRTALVEAHAPFACGWYGDDPCEYTYWQAEAWKQWAERPTGR